MKKTIIAAMLATSLIGCANTKNPAPAETQENVSTSEELFYNAFLGEIMETEGQTNNAIKHYETILSSQYETEYFNKLLQLYQYKNDFVSARNLIENTNVQDLLEHHPENVFVLYLTQEDYDSALDFFENSFDIENIESNDIIPYYNSTYSLFSSQLSFYFQDSEIKTDFLNLLKEKDKNKYDFLTLTLSRPNISEFKNYDHNDFSDIESEIVKIRKTISGDYPELLKESLKSKYLSDSAKQELLNKYAVYYIQSRNFVKAKDLYEHTAKNKIEAPDSLVVADSLYYFYNFKHNDSLYKLETIKDIIDPDSYYLQKGMTNYMLGYKSAARKYFREIKNVNYAIKYIHPFIDVMGEKYLYKFVDNENQADFFLAEYYIQKGNQDKAIEYIENSIEKLSETGDNDEFIKVVEMQKLRIQDPIKALESLKLEIENSDDILFVNDYIYLSLQKNINNVYVDELFKKHSKELIGNESFIDTVAYYYLKRNRPYQAIKTYEDNNLLNIHNSEVQGNISEAFKAIGNRSLEKKHKEYSNMLKGN